MRLAIAIFLAAVLAIPAIITSSSPGVAAVKATDISSQQKKKKKSDGNTQDPPGTPSKGQSTY